MAKITFRKAFQGRFDGNSASQKGLTLIELALVVGIFALIILASLIALNALMEQRRVTQAVTDIASIRSAVTKWSAGGPVTIIKYVSGEPTVDTERTLRRWSQLAGFLPEPLERLAEKQQTLRIEAASPWGSFYQINILPVLAVAGRCLPGTGLGIGTPPCQINPNQGKRVIVGNPRIWAMTVDVPPKDLAEPLGNALRNSGALAVSIVVPGGFAPGTIGITFIE